MDPDEALRLVRLTAKQLRVDETEGTFQAHALDLADYFEALDEWLCIGGFLPKDWHKEETPKLVRLTGDRDGKTYDPEIDFDRLNKQMQLVWSVIRTGRWYSLNELAELTGCPTPSVSARLRDLRKPKFGAQEIERKRIEGGYWVYRLVASPNPKEWAE